MSVYKSNNTASSITAIEFPKAEENLSATAQEQFITFHVKSDADKNAVMAKLTSPSIGMSIVTETKMDGAPLLIARGSVAKEQLLQKLGGQFHEFVPKKKMDPWKVRGWMSIIGQPLQLVSGYMNKGGIDGATVTFAISNLIANGTNVLFGAEKTKDANHLKVLKESFNRSIADYVPDKAALPAPDQSQQVKRPVNKDAIPTPSVGRSISNFMQRYSVTVGEIGLRFFGAIALAFPVARWKDGWNTAFNLESKKASTVALKDALDKTVKAGLTEENQKALESSLAKFDTGLAHHIPIKDAVSKSLGEKVLSEESKAALADAAKTLEKDLLGSSFMRGLKEANFNTLKKGIIKAYNTDRYTGAAGVTYLVGKTIALTSKVPDPYNPVPQTPIDKFREKGSFRVASVIETAAAGIIAYDRLLRKVPDGNGGMKLARQIIWPNKKFIPAFMRGVPTRDWLGGIGGTLFMVAQAFRLFAPYGVRQLDMKELDAHMTEGLAQVPQEKLPELIANTAVSLKKHFGDKAPDVTQIFSQLAGDLKRYHNIDITAPKSLQGIAEAPAAEQDKAKSYSVEVKKTVKITQMPQAGTFQERAASTPDAAALGA